MKLANKVCLIAGGSGAIGSAIARRYAHEGAKLAITYLSARPENVCEGIGEGVGRIACYRLNITDRERVQIVIEQIRADFGCIDVLVNCTGIQGPIGPLETLDMGDWARTIETNLLGAVYLTHAVLPLMKERGRGKIILLSGGGATNGRPYFTSYSSSKAAVVRFAESLAQELEGANIQVNAIAPGPVRSRMWDEMRAAVQVGGRRLREELKSMDETGGASPDRAAGLAVFLASDQSNRLTGRLFSALWDDWEHFEDNMERIVASDAFTLRRVPLK